MSPSSQTRALLANQPFVVLLVARTLSMLGMAFSPVALAFGILALPGADAGTLSIVLAANMAPLAIFTLVGGVVADRYPRKVVLMIGEALAALGWIGIGVMMLAGHTPLWLMCTAAAISGVAAGIVYPALNGIIPDLVPALQRQTANAWLAMGASASRLLGVVSGGAVVVLLGAGWALVVAGGLFALAAACLMLLPNQRGTIAGEGQHPIRQLVEGWSEFSSRQWLWVVVVQWAFMVMMLQASEGVLGPVVADEELGGAGAWTIILAGQAVGAIVGVLMSMFWQPRRPILTATLFSLISGLPAILLGLSAPMWALIGSMFLLGVAFDLYGVLWMTTMQDEVPPESLSRVASYDALGSLMLGPLGLILAGPAILAFGVHESLIGAGVIATVVTGLALFSREVRQLRSRRREHLEVDEVVADVATASPLM